MNLVPALPAALAGLFLFLVPGLVLLALLSRRDQDALADDEALFLMVATSVAASGWVGLVLAEAGRFHLVTAAAVLGTASFLALLAGRKRLAWPLRRPASWTALLPAAIVLTLALGLQARPSQYLVGGRDPGAYVAAMGVIARTGAIVYTDPGVLSIPPEDVELFYRNAANAPFSWSRFMGFDLESPRTGRVFPQFFHLFPAFGAYLFQAMGVKGALATAPVFGILGTLGVFFAFRRFFGPPPALLAALLLGLNVVQVWFARYPVSETVSQFLLFLGLLAFWHWEERGSALFGALAGAALGLTLLVRIDSVLVVAPLGLYVFIRRARRDLTWRAALPLLVPFALLAVHAGVHGAFWARKYLLSIAMRRYWHQPTAVWLGLAVLAIAALLVADRVGPRVVRWLEAREGTLRAAATAGVVLLALYAYFLRPELSAWAGADGYGVPRAEAVHHPLLVKLGYAGVAAHDSQSFVRLGWFVSPLGLLLGMLGLVLAIREWRPRWLFPLLLAVSFSGFYFYKIRVWNDYFFALRRFVPVTIPFLLGLAALLLVRMARSGGVRRALAAALALALAVLYARDTERIAAYVDWRNAVPFVSDVARRFTPEDVVIFEQPRSIHLLSLPLWAAHGVNVLELARFNPDPDRLNDLFRAWRGRYRNIYFVHTYRTDLCGVFLQRVEDHSFGTWEWERTYDRPPSKPEPRALHFTVSRVVPPEELRVPPLPEVDVGGTDDFQVSGFFDKEGGGDRTFRWTGACGSVYLPGARPGAMVVITAAVGERPATKPATVRSSLSGMPLGAFTVGSGWSDYSVRLPDPLPPGPPVLRLDVPPFRPGNQVPGSTDPRDLGVMVDRIRVEGAPGRIGVSTNGGGGR